MYIISLLTSLAYCLTGTGCSQVGASEAAAEDGAAAEVAAAGGFGGTAAGIPGLVWGS